MQQWDPVVCGVFMNYDTTVWTSSEFQNVVIWQMHSCSYFPSFRRGMGAAACLRGSKSIERSICARVGSACDCVSTLQTLNSIQPNLVADLTNTIT